MSVFANEKVEDLKAKSVRGGAITITAQGLKFAMQTGGVMILARILSPADFGLQSMVVALTGFLGLFRDGGLSAATVQRDVINHDQTSTLFWINAAVGLLLSLMAAAAAPALVSFYREPRLLWAIIVSGLAFFFNGIAAQHQALLVRQLRFATVSGIEVLALAAGTVVGVVMAFQGMGYWALVGMAVSGPATAAVALWIAVPWIPGAPKPGCGIRSMLHVGGASTANMVVTYFGYNTEKFLLGRFWGAAPLGLYSRAFQLANLPMHQLSASIFNVIFPALSRIQDDAERVRRFFLKAYSLIASIAIPIALACAVYPGDVIAVVLGSDDKWRDSVPLLRLLSPTILVFVLLNPIGWFLLSTGRAWRCLQTGLVITPVMIVGVLAGMRYGPAGVAAGYSIAMTSLLPIVIAWALRGTGIRIADIARALAGPAVAGSVAAAAGILFIPLSEGVQFPVARLLMDVVVLFGAYAAMLVFGMRQQDFYRDLLRQALQRRRNPIEKA